MPDWGGLVDRGLEKVEDGWDATKKAVGEGVGKAAHGVGDVLDTVGAHDWADKVDDWGDDVASDLGATVGEQQLGQTRQADELVHGKPAVIQESVSHLMEFQAAFDRVGQGMRALDSGHWKGAAADAFREKFAMHPADWLHASDACRAAADALRYYGETVHWAQEQAGQAIELYEQGVKARKEWAEAYKTKAAAYTAAVRAGHDPGACPTPGEDPGEAARVRAQEILAEARRQRDDAAATAQQAVSTATEKAPAMPSASDRAWGTFVDYEAGQAVELNHFMGGVLKGTAGTLNFARGLNPYDAYNVTHPAEYAQHVNMTLAGLISTAVHPERVPGALLEPFKDDPSEGFGRLVPELLGTKGMGGAKVGTRLAAREGFAARRSPLESLASRGSGDHLPSHDDVLRAVKESKPEVLSRTWPDTDGRYYATRVLKGGRPDGQTVFAGHGYLERDAGEIVVPEGTSISFYVPHEERIPGLSGVAVEGGSYPGPAVETLRPGARVPNYTLGPPEAAGANGFTVYENSVTVDRRTRLADLLKENMGDVHWAACREIKNG